VRRIWVGAFLVPLAACGSSDDGANESQTLAEYAAEVERLVIAVNERIDALDAGRGSQTPTVESARTYWERRMEARVEFLEAFQALDPPDHATEMHETVLDLIGRLTAAEETLAARVMSFETATTPEQWWDTPEGLAARAVDEEGFAICRAAQTELDTTEDREVLEDVPWLPSEMSEAIRVVLGCPE
jgi:hypothetical protein